jgi:hypothetical protein
VSLAARCAGRYLLVLTSIPLSPLALGGEHVGFDIKTHHHGAVGVGAQTGQSGGKERPASQLCPPLLIPHPPGGMRVSL